MIKWGRCQKRINPFVAKFARILVFLTQISYINSTFPGRKTLSFCHKCEKPAAFRKAAQPAKLNAAVFFTNKIS